MQNNELGCFSNCPYLRARRGHVIYQFKEFMLSTYVAKRISPCLLLSSVWHRRTSEIPTHACHARKFLARFIPLCNEMFPIPFSDACTDCYQRTIRGLLDAKRIFTYNSPTDYFLPLQTEIAKRRNARYHAYHTNDT